MKENLLQNIEERLLVYDKFFKEFKKECDVRFGQVIDFLKDLKDNIENACLPETLYGVFSKIIGQFKMDDLEGLMRANEEHHDYDIYNNEILEIVNVYSLTSPTYNLFKTIGFVSTNLVLVGANGCGKTTFANSIRENLEMTENGIVIPAQKLLIFPELTNIPLKDAAYSDYNKYKKEILDDKNTYTIRPSVDFPYDLAKKYSSELKILISYLISERNHRRNEYFSKTKPGAKFHPGDVRTHIDDVLDIWNNLIEHRTLFCDNDNKLKIRYVNTLDQEEEYPAYEMSDGEREIFYVVSRVLLAPEGSLIIVDEPEMHLHKAILNKLWDTLEKLRNKCIFIYLTHDVEFASSRIATKCWLKSYRPSSLAIGEWEIEKLPTSEIPEALLLKLLGSRKRILFCEGNEKSLDKQIYEKLFPDYTIVALESCKNVINYTLAFNQIHNKYACKFWSIWSQAFR